jgi:chemotaxis protein CheD
MKVPDQILEVFLQPGDIYWGDQNTRIRTILGSCVSICLWHPQFKHGGMTHIMLPGRKKDNLNGKLDGKYADEAWEIFLIEMKNLGTRPIEYVAKLFGGANMFDTTDKYTIGMKNIEIAKDILSKNKLQIVSENIGGTKSRRIHFDIWSGNVWLKNQEFTG